MAEIANKEPTEFRAGDSLTWKRQLSDYPSTEYTLKYAFRGNTGSFDITASSSDSDHLVSVSPTITAAYDAGFYHVQGYVEKSGARHTVFESRIEVKPDLAAAGSTFDGRTHARKVLSNIEAVLENRSTKEIDESEIEGVKIKRIAHSELLALASKYRGLVKQEEAAERLKLGQGSGRTVLVRFGP